MSASKFCDACYKVTVAEETAIMELDTASTSTSLEDKTEDFAFGDSENPTRESLAEGLVALLKPTIDQLDERVRVTKISQVELKQQIDALAEELRGIAGAQQCPVDLDHYVKKLVNARRRVTIVSTVLQTTQERLNKLHQLVQRETGRRRPLLEPSPAGTPSTSSLPFQI